MRYPFPVTLMQHDPAAQAEAMGGLPLRLMSHKRVPQRQIVLPFEWAEEVTIGPTSVRYDSLAHNAGGVR